MSTPVPTPLTRTQALAGFGAGLTYDRLPPEVRHEAKRALLDWIAAALAGSAEPASARLRRVITQVAPDPVASVLGTEVRTSAPFAALANGYASHLQDFDDVFNPEQTTVHLSSCVWPVVLAVSQARTLSGTDAIAAFVAGFETGARVGCAAGVTHYESSWQVTGTAGHLAGAAAGARALGLAAGPAAHALGIASAQASGIREIYGSDTKALQPGKAAMDGVLAALLAEQGFTSRDTALEGPRGLLSAISRDPDPDFLDRNLGSEWNLRLNGHKLYPSASLTHPAVDAAIVLARRPGFVADEVESVEVRMLPFAADVTAPAHPAPGSDAKFSTPHCLAVALLTGRLGLRDFDDELVFDPAVKALRERVSVVGDTGVGKQGARLVAVLRGGRTFTAEVASNRGTPANPLTDADLEAKLAAIAEPRYGREAVRALTGLCWDLEDVEDLADTLAPLARPLDGAA
jgi:2-methylcitrate dehydratase PrpD